MDLKKLQLEHQHAAIKYDASGSVSLPISSSSSSSSSGGGSSIYIQSMKFYDRNSTRIEGIEGEFDMICRSLGLTGPEDLAIPAAEWEAARSAPPRRWSRGLSSEESPSSSVAMPSSTSTTTTADPRPPDPWIFATEPASESRERNDVAEGERHSLSDSKGEQGEQKGRRSNNISPNGRIKRIIITGDWQKGELLGRGSFGSVYEGISIYGFFFAVKEVSLLDQSNQGKQSVYQLEQEIALLSQFEHENIVQYYGTETDGSNLFIFLELVTRGSLASLYRRYTLRHSQVSAYTRQILHGLKYLHDHNVVHRDIKCANILVDTNGSVKLADFGLATVTKSNDLKSYMGTAFWMAPEVVKGKNQGYGLPADMWSLGCTVLEMLTGQIPYFELDYMQALFRIGKGERPPVPDSLPRDARDFILQCLQANPVDRPTAAQLLNHPFTHRPLSQSSGSSFPNIPGRKG